MKTRWTILSHQDIGTANWRVTVQNDFDGEIKTGVYPFNLEGKVYELECQPGTWVMASCGGYKIESSWEGKTAEQAYRLKGTGEIIYTYSTLVYDWAPIPHNYILYQGQCAEVFFSTFNWYTCEKPKGYAEYFYNYGNPVSVISNKLTNGWYTVSDFIQTGTFTMYYYDSGYISLPKLIEITLPFMSKEEVLAALDLAARNHVKSFFNTPKIDYPYINSSEARADKTKINPLFNVPSSVFLANGVVDGGTSDAVIKKTVILSGVALSYMSNETIKNLLNSLIGE